MNDGSLDGEGGGAVKPAPSLVVHGAYSFKRMMEESSPPMSARQRDRWDPSTTPVNRGGSRSFLSRSATASHSRGTEH